MAERYTSVPLVPGRDLHGLSFHRPVVLPEGWVFWRIGNREALSLFVRESNWTSEIFSPFGALTRGSTAPPRTLRDGRVAFAAHYSFMKDLSLSISYLFIFYLEFLFISSSICLYVR
jgi:hypothetical protein